MKKILLFISISLSTLFAAQSQITYSSADYAVGGDTFLVSVAKVDTVGITNFQITGANYTWNYSNLIPQSQYTDRYLTAQATGYKLSYTTACVAGGGGVAACNSSWNALVNLGHQQLDSLNLGSFQFSNVDNLYYKSTTDLPVNIVGMTFGLGGVNFPLTFKYTIPDTVYRFPLAYNNQDSSVSSYAIDLASLGINFTYNVNAKRVNQVQGWGQLITPYKTYNSTLKLKTLIYSYDTLIYGSSTIPVPSTTSVIYSWFDTATKRPVLVVDGNVIDTTVVYTDIEYIDTQRCLTPNAQFTPNPLVPYLDQSTGTVSVGFNNSSINSNKYSWNFGDSTSGALDTSSLSQPSHTYDSAGVYKVTLIACNSICSPLRCDTFTEPITIFDSTNTQSSFTYTPLTPCTGDTVKFTNTSLNANSYAWNFGDNTTSSLKNPKKAYIDTGTYTVTLIAIGSVKSDTSYQQIQVSTIPVASISPSGTQNICSADSVILTASGGDYYRWSNNQVTTSITVKNSGIYYVTAYNNCGNAVSLADTVNVLSSVTPTISIAPNSGSIICPATSVTFNATVANGGSSPQYQWLKNGANVGTNAGGYSFSGFANNDSVWCILTSNVSCAGANPVKSNVIKMTVKPNSTSNVAQSICPGTAYSFNGRSLSGAGTYYDTLTSANGCDSIVNLTLTVKPNSNSSLSQSICQGSTYSFGGHTLSTAGTYPDTLTSANGCDSIVTLTLTVRPNSTGSLSQSICQGSTYSFGGHSLSTAGTYRDTLTSANGCDSIVTLTLTVKPNSTGSLSESICQGSTYSFGGHSLSTAGTYRDTLTSANGCDSIVTLTLTVKPNSTSSLSQSICQGSSYSFGGHTLSTAGTYRDTLTSANGCDSIVTLTLTVKPNSASSLSQSICQGSSYSFNGRSLSAGGTYYDTLTSANGCDSIVTLTLTVKPNSNSSLSQSICQGSTYSFGGHTLSTAGIYRDTLTSANGCDSIITLTLSLVNGFQTSISDSICSGGQYVFGGHPLTQSGTYHDTLTSIGSCDSIVTLHLVVLALPSSTVHAAICQGSGYNFNGTVLSVSGVYPDTLHNASAGGCDSLVTLDLVVNPKPSPVITQYGNDTLETTSPFAHYQWLSGSAPIAGDTNRVIIALQNATYSVVVYDSNGCSDTSATITLTKVGIKDINRDQSVKLYPNPNTGSFVVETSNAAGAEFMVYDIIGTMIRRGVISTAIQTIDMNELSSGVYYFQIKAPGSSLPIQFVITK